MATLTMLEQAPTPKSVNRGTENFNDLTTETANAASEGLDTKSALEIARIINHEDAKYVRVAQDVLMSSRSSRRELIALPPTRLRSSI